MLPFNKRHRETQPSVSALPRFPLPSLSAVAPAPMRKRAESFSDEERTQLMQRRTLAPVARPISTPPAPPPSRRVAPPVPQAPASRPPSAPPARMAQRVFPPKPTMDDPTRTAYGPMGTAPVAQLVIPGPPKMPSEIPPAVASVPPPAALSTGDLPAAVITSNTKIVQGRPTASWTAALVAVGVFLGLVTAVLARGDGDALLSSVVDAKAAPQAQLAAAAAAQPVANVATVMPVKDEAKVAVAPAVVADVKGVDVTAAAKPEAKADKPEAIKPEAKADKPEAKVTVPAKVAVKPAAPPPVVVKPVVAAPKVDTAATKVAAAKPAPAAKKPAADDMDSASAADALAKAQLEAALGR